MLMCLWRVGGLLGIQISCNSEIMLVWSTTKMQRERNDVGFIAIFSKNTEGKIT